MRLFTAFELPRGVRGEIVERCEAAQGELPRARWQGADTMHLTLVFLGEVAEDRLPALDEAGRTVLAAEGPLRLSVGPVGAFPSRARARVAWLGIDSDRPLEPLHGRLARACAGAAGVEVDEKPYRPHLTLARCDPPWTREDIDRLAQRFTRRIAEPFEVREAVLFRSHLGKGPARHEVVRRWPLGSEG